jgi:hypothetical protein
MTIDKFLIIVAMVATVIVSIGIIIHLYGKEKDHVDMNFIYKLLGCLILVVELTFTCILIILPNH